METTIKKHFWPKRSEMGEDKELILEGLLLVAAV
jgi:hypothetical protein